MPLPPLALSIGEPGGIGPDIVLRLFADRVRHALPPFLVYGQLEQLSQRAERLGLELDIVSVKVERAAEQFATALPVMNVGYGFDDQPGTLSIDTAQNVIDAITQATGDTLAGACRGLVTAPIHKSVLYDVGFKYPGHTEYLAALCAEKDASPHPVMMLAHEDLRVVPLTIHVPLRQVAELVTTDLIIATARIVVNDLRERFGIEKPRLAIAGLNPHAGEDGTIGIEDRDIVTPAVAQMADAGIDVEGPLSADTLFHPAHWRQYDAVIAMYHDQALIPIKTLAFDAGVNVTLGLPIVRTSPDHGTALDIAGTGKASVNSMLAAIRLADKLTGGRA